ncbi:DUF6804 family protein [Brevundimonas sp.]|uniref:DUF6804 family protein n=1 Tax=Brevundimonas sp. TaxID=1871086 RepID=UPI002FD986A7
MSTEHEQFFNKLNGDFKLIWLAPIVLLALALAPWPYGYFMLLRVAVCGAAIWLAYNLLNSQTLRGLGWVFVAVAILYNPVFRIHFERELWMALNIASVVPFAFTGWISKKLSLS